MNSLSRARVSSFKSVCLLSSPNEKSFGSSHILGDQGPAASVDPTTAAQKAERISFISDGRNDRMNSRIVSNQYLKAVGKLKDKCQPLTFKS